MAGSEGFIYQRPGSRRRQPDLHALIITELYVRLREDERAGRLELLTFEPEQFARMWVEAGTFEPDAFARVRAAKTWRWFVEADEGTEDRGQMFGKLKEYAKAYTSWPSLGFPYVLFVTERVRRKEIIERWVGQQPEDMRPLFYVAMLDEAVSTLVAPDGTGVWGTR
jgi:hypothetical protein